MKVERADINQLLQQMKQMQTQVSEQRGIKSPIGTEGLGLTQGVNGANATTGAGKAPGFGEMFQQAIGSVNNTQQQASALSTSFEQGDPGVSLAQVMVASQKASVSFQALTQVRNRLVDAYKDIMNMPV
ncbi:MAG: Flagellar hook-basal body complex protein FliE [Verrucomicrobiaceae bacterium]|nr:Flagellar hook-basal body complex protein FliE [Verrucomicrobiaceae bacterium]